MAEKKKREEIPEEEYKGMVFEDGGSLVVDLTNVKAATFEALPKGVYQAEVDEVTFGLAQTSGAPMLTFIFRITEGEYTDKKVYNFMSFSRKALPFTKAGLARIEPALTTQRFDPERLANQGDPVTLQGRPVQLRLGIRDGEMGEQNTVQILPPKKAGEQAFFQPSAAA